VRGAGSQQRGGQHNAWAGASPVITLRGGGDVGAQGRQSKHRRREGRFEAGSRS
jgi:hypothetical protein